jgi:hypothetical protein
MFRKAILAIGSLIALASSASAQSPVPASAMCGERSAIIEQLKHQFGEEQEDVSLQSDQALVELFASERGTWSILLSAPSGVSCVVAAGKGLVTQAKS